jgi:hypothetical protein
MKNNSLNILGLALTLVFALGLAGCGANPEDLAKQTYNLHQESIAAMDNPLKLPGVMLKAASLGRKVNSLSESDRQIFDEELERLGGTGLDGLFDIEELSSLFGGGDGGGAKDGATASSGGASNANAVGDGSAAAPTTVGKSGGKTSAFFNMFDSGTYHMKAKTTVSGMEVISETYIKGDMMASVGETGGMSYRTIKRDNSMYVIDDRAKTVMVMSLSASFGSATEEPVRTAGMIVTGSGTALFNGKNLPYEEYSLAGESSVRVQLFLDGNNLAGMRTIAVGQTIDTIILALDQNVPNSVFEIPAGYQRMELPQ